MGRTGSGGVYRVLLLPDFAAYGEFVVCGGISCGVGLGGDLFLFGARQRDGGSGASAEFVDARGGVAEWGISWAGGQRVVLCGDCGGLGGVCEGVSGAGRWLGFVRFGMTGMVFQIGSWFREKVRTPKRA